MKNLIEVKLKSSSHFYDEPFPHGFLFCMSACVIIEFLSFWHICWFLAASSDKKKKNEKKWILIHLMLVIVTERIH